MTSRMDPNSPGLVFYDVARLMRMAFEREVDRADVTITSGEARVLAHMSRCGAMRQTQLAERLGLSPMSISGFLDRLERAGLILRSPDSRDRRAKVVTLTDAAIPLLAEVANAGERARQTAFAGISQKDSDQFMDTYLKLRENLETARCSANTAEAVA